MKKVFDLSGKWVVVELPDLVDDYLKLSDDPHVTLLCRRNKLSGEYEFGVQNGVLDGEIIEEIDGNIAIQFSFEGQDETDPVHGFGLANLTNNNTITGKMHYHMSDTCRFTWKRSKTN
jgi:hypothetical protein